MTAPDPAVAAALVRLGQDPDNRAGRDTATATRCRLCGAPVLAGLDDRVAGRPVVVDPNPLTVRDEATAWLSAPPRPTYRLVGVGRKVQISARDRWSIAGTPPETVHVVAAHRCRQPLGTPLPPPTPPTADEGIPF